MKCLLVLIALLFDRLFQDRYEDETFRLMNELRDRNHRH